jgi:hypothetical protein
MSSATCSDRPYVATHHCSGSPPGKRQSVTVVRTWLQLAKTLVILGLAAVPVAVERGDRDRNEACLGGYSPGFSGIP